jgi:hypothetical protein
VKTLESIVFGTAPGDEVIVDVNLDGDYGNRARTRMMAKASGDFLLFMDDDDHYTEGALGVIRSALTAEPDRMHMFRMLMPRTGRLLWEEPVVRENNVSTQMVAVPNRPEMLGCWSERYAADYDFIHSTCELMGEPVWHENVIALVFPRGPQIRTVL